MKGRMMLAVVDPIDTDVDGSGEDNNADLTSEGMTMVNPMFSLGWIKVASVYNDVAIV